MSVAVQEASATGQTVPADSPSSRRFWLIIPALIAVLAFSLGAAISLGTVTIPLGDVWGIVAHWVMPGAFESWWSSAREAIVLESRMPRAIMAAEVGAALALSGAVAQAVTRNPLADPYLLGVSSGAGLGVVLVIVLGLGAGTLGAFTLPAAAFLGALLPLAATVVITYRSQDVTAVILAGVALSMLFSSVITYLLLVVANEQQLSAVMHWLAGGFGGARWSMLAYPSVVLLLVGVGCTISGRWMNLLHAGDDGAAALGMNVRRFRIVVLLAVSLLTASAVAVSGTIGFIGLLIPHLAGYVVGRNAVRLLPVAALLGAVAMVGADIIAGSVSDGTELPVGVVTGLIGAPVFIIMLMRQYGRNA